MRVMEPVARRVRVSQMWTSLPVTRMVASRDIKIKYKQAALGPLWRLIAPLGLLAAVTIAFYGVTKVNTSGVPYVLFALVGLCVWIYIQLTLMTAPLALVSNAVLVRRSTCPRIALVAARFRDIVSIVPLIVQAGIFITPVGYPLAGAPANIKILVSLNPATGVIEAWRWALLSMTPSVAAMCIAAIWTVVLPVFAWFVFGRLEIRLADYI